MITLKKKVTEIEKFLDKLDNRRSSWGDNNTRFLPKHDKNEDEDLSDIHKTI